MRAKGGVARVSSLLNSSKLGDQGGGAVHVPRLSLTTLALTHPFDTTLSQNHVRSFVVRPSPHRPRAVQNPADMNGVVGYATIDDDTVVGPPATHLFHLPIQLGGAQRRILVLAYAPSHSLPPSPTAVLADSPAKKK